MRALLVHVSVQDALRTAVAVAAAAPLCPAASFQQLLALLNQSLDALLQDKASTTRHSTVSTCEPVYHYTAHTV
jgi:hypothetical protein